ncbi:MAG: hypothetical protein ACR2PF_12870 [Rhizobiaceae bacterium]
MTDIGALRVGLARIESLRENWIRLEVQPLRSFVLVGAVDNPQLDRTVAVAGFQIAIETAKDLLSLCGISRNQKGRYRRKKG